MSPDIPRIGHPTSGVSAITEMTKAKAPEPDGMDEADAADDAAEANREGSAGRSDKPAPVAQRAEVEQADPLAYPLAHPRLSLVTPTSLEQQQSTTAAMDRLSLEQALLDVEVANGRMLDLTARLVEANQRAGALRSELDGFRQAAVEAEVSLSVEQDAARAELAVERENLAAQQSHLDKQKASTAYRWAAKVWNLRNAIRS